jgi:hypothetical protein
MFHRVERSQMGFGVHSRTGTHRSAINEVSVECMQTERRINRESILVVSHTLRTQQQATPARSGRSLIYQFKRIAEDANGKA